MTNNKILIRDTLKSSTEEIALDFSFLKDRKEKDLNCKLQRQLT